MSRSYSATTLVALLILAAAALFLACDDKPNAPAPPVETVIADSLAFMREDSTGVVMGTTPLACCGLYDPSFVNERAIGHLRPRGSSLAGRS
jgi:hypothetical protein